MHSEEKDIFEITESDETFEQWADVEFVNDDIRDAIKNSSVLLVPSMGFRSSDEPVFPTTTEEIFQFFKEHLPSDLLVEICANDDAIIMLALHSDYKRLGKFFVKKAALPVFIAVLTAYITNKISVPQETKPQVIIINNVVQQQPVSPAPTPTIIPAPKKTHQPHKYHDASKVTFTINVQDTIGKTKSFHYEGPVDGVKPVTDQIQKTFLDEPKKTDN